MTTAIRDALRGLAGVDADELVNRLDDVQVRDAYERDNAEARSAAGTPAEAQGKTSERDGAVRFTAPSVVFERHGTRLVAGGWQPPLAYDVLLANLAPELKRTPPPEAVTALFERLPDALTTAEVAALLARGPDYVPDQNAAEQALIDAAATGELVRTPCGNDAVWRKAAADL